ncbi:MAG: hypothetical protein APR62_08930 [Smithella sp. SDB]|nr:MAG: hypothetical protein APR62_08930 [Smithella sp. SDB]
MSIFEKIDKADLKELLIKNWMTHDAMWLYHCVNECGIDKMNTINQAAVKSMASIEIQRIRKLLGIPKDKKIETIEELMAIMETAMEIVKGDFMDFTYSATPEGVLSWKWNKCFAYDGIKSLGLLDDYKCGILIRINSWLDTLGIKYEITPVIDKCIMHTKGRCEGEYRIFL